MADETIGSTGGNNAPLGTVAVSGSQTSETPTEPSVVDIPGDDALIRVPGIDKPVKYGEHVRGFQKQYTQASQRAAQLERELAAERAARQKFEQERQLAQRPNERPDPFAAAKERGYFTAEDAGELVQTLTGQLAERDQVLRETVKELLRVRSQFGEVYGNYTNQEFGNKVTKWITEAGYDAQDEGIKNIAEEIYLAYEGKDLDQEFPRIFTERLKQLENYFERRKRESFERARRTPFVPGRGGQVGPTKPLQLEASASARQIADQMWPAFGSESGT